MVWTCPEEPGCGCNFERGGPRGRAKGTCLVVMKEDIKLVRR